MTRKSSTEENPMKFIFSFIVRYLLQFALVSLSYPLEKLSVVNLSKCKKNFTYRRVTNNESRNNDIRVKN